MALSPLGASKESCALPNKGVHKALPVQYIQNLGLDLLCRYSQVCDNQNFEEMLKEDKAVGPTERYRSRFIPQTSNSGVKPRSTASFFSNRNQGPTLVQGGDTRPALPPAGGTSVGRRWGTPMGCTVNAGRVEAATCLEPKGFGKELGFRLTLIGEVAFNLVYEALKARF
jgi:hypothetical protein